MPRLPRSHNASGPRKSAQIAPATPHFAQLGRLPPGGGTLSRGLILITAIGVFAALVALVWDLQHAPVREQVVEVSFMEDEAAQAEAALEAPTTTTAPAAPAAPATTSEKPQEDAN
ncbi:MAG: hypothetical protein GXP62_18610 [Oligoflexia bacterium]|nr:hypothetical protein [Oligoflexia bacterium]